MCFYSKKIFELFALFLFVILASIKSSYAGEYQCEIYGSEEKRRFTMSLERDVLIINGKYRHYRQPSKYEGEIDIFSNSKYKYTLAYYDEPMVDVIVENRWGLSEKGFCLPPGYR